MIQLLVLLSALTCPAMDSDLEISNEDIVWDFGYFGMGAGLGGKTRISSDRASKEDTDFLLRALDDPKRFAAAHVLLGNVYGQKGEHPEDSWYGLSVELRGDF